MRVRLRRRCDFARRRDWETLLDDLRHFLAGGDQLKDAPVNLPVAELLGAERVMTQVRDMEAVGEVVEHDAACTAERADRPGLVQRMKVVPAHLLAPVPSRGLEAESLGRRARGEQDHAGLGRTNSSLVRCALVVGKQAVSHLVQTPSAGLSQTCPS